MSFWVLPIILELKLEALNLEKRLFGFRHNLKHFDQQFAGIYVLVVIFGWFKD